MPKHKKEKFKKERSKQYNTRSNKRRHLSGEQLNFLRMVSIIFDVISVGLRRIFRREWDSRYKEAVGSWENTPDNGERFYNKEVRSCSKENERHLVAIKTGDIETWDCTCLFFAILFSNSIGGSYSRKLEKNVAKNVQVLRSAVRNGVLHRSKGKLTDEEFKDCVQTVRCAFSELGLKTLIGEIKRIEDQKTFENMKIEELERALHESKRCLEEMQQIQSKKDDRPLMQEETRESAFHRKGCATSTTSKCNKDDDDDDDNISMHTDQTSGLGSSLDESDCCNISSISRSTCQDDQKSIDDEKSMTSGSLNKVSQEKKPCQDKNGRLKIHPPKISIQGKPTLFKLTYFNEEEAPESDSAVALFNKKIKIEVKWENEEKCFVSTNHLDPRVLSPGECTVDVYTKHFDFLGEASLSCEDTEGNVRRLAEQNQGPGV